MIMQLLSTERFITQGDRPEGVFPGAVSYVDEAQTILFRYGRVAASDTYDEWTDIISGDNGQGWTAPVLRHAGYDVAEGRMVYSENTALYDPHTARTLFIHDRGLRGAGMAIKQIRWELAFQQYDHATGAYAEREINSFGFSQGIMISLSRPIITAAGRALIPAQTPVLDEAGNRKRHPDCRARALEALVIIGERDADWWRWHAGGRASLPLDVSSRGIFEPAVAELGDGRLAMICRGDNSAFPERPGFKWLCISEDAGESWGKPEPLRFADDALLESGSNGSALFRSRKTGKLYWIGNPCLAGRRAHGNNPRAPLAIFAVREEPFALLRDSILIIDDRRREDAAGVQFSNFRLLEERGSGDAVLFMTRLGEQSDADFRRADLYRYRIALD